MGHWNHRVLAHKDKVSEEVVFIIHEVFYDKDGKPDSYTAEGIAPLGESIRDLKKTLRRMKLCIDKPILDADNWPNEYKPKEYEGN